MTTLLKVSVIANTRDGMKLLVAGQPVPDNFIDHIPDHLLTHTKPDLPKPETTEQDEEDTGATPAESKVEEEEQAPVPATESDSEPAEPVAGEAEEEAGGGVPYQNESVSVWRTYAASLGVSTDGLKKAAIILAVAKSLGITTDGMQPAKMVDAIRAATE